MELPSLGELEIRVLRLVWRHQPCTERQITELIRQDRQVVRTTVLKTMQRLEVKGMLARVPGEGPVRFRASLAENYVLHTLIGRFVERVLGGLPEPLIGYLADSGKLSAQDLEILALAACKNGKTARRRWPDASGASGEFPVID